ncbi:FUSC family protein [Nocardioides sp. Kera G14]|uniref:FUSC family protein n=1 Tax=Nocardioides sp. Kera G14 TaxID=2884264 RepID=UPI001D10FC33|nr:FUSC family protein [Nocardioides sp. Kera G14]UDY23487.1 FUSC family protein [Nocardioides sp. Kera G14]
MTSSPRLPLHRRLVQVGPHNNAHLIAARASVSLGVPLVVLSGIGHPEWSLYAAFGAFASLYGRERGGWQRTRLQLVIALTQTACVTLGALVGASSARAWWAVPIAAFIAGGAAWESARMGWHPPGALFQVFGFAAVASVPGHLSDVGTAAACSASAAAFALVVGAVGSLWRHDWIDPREPPIGGRAGGRIPYAVLSAVGVLVAGLVATGSGIGRPYWAMVAAAVPLAARDWNAQLTRGLQRLIGTALGLAAAVALLALDPRGLVLIVVVVCLQALAELLIGRNYALALIAVTPLALLMGNLAAPIPAHTLVTERGLETLTGVLIALVLGGVVTLARTRRMRQGMP